MSTAEAVNKVPSELPMASPRRVIVCAGTGCMANGSLKVFQAMKQEMAAAGLNVVLEFRPEGNGDGIRVSESGCQGFCQMGPLVTVLPEGILYTKVKPGDAKEIVETTLVNHQPVARLLYLDPQTRKRCTGPNDIPFYQRQTRFVLKECGLIDPEDITEYIADGGYDSARKAYLEMEPQAICEVILKSGLRGRGGGGFPTGRKWEAARVQNSAKKYVICNGDEGDPGAFMDRSVMEGNPHSVLEGMMIAARAIGADEGYIYVRAEYPLAVQPHAQGGGGRGEARASWATTFSEPAAAALRGDGRRGGVRLRRGDGDDRLDRGPARHAAAQAAVPGPERTVGQADDHQQRRNAGARGAHSAATGRETSASSAPRIRPAPRPSR